MPGRRWYRPLGDRSVEPVHVRSTGVSPARSPLMEQQLIRSLVGSGLADVRKIEDDAARTLLASADGFLERIPDELLQANDGSTGQSFRLLLGRVQGQVMRSHLLREDGDEPTYALANVSMQLQVRDGSTGAVVKTATVNGADRRIKPAGCYCPGVCYCPGCCQGCCSGCCSGCCGGCCTGCCSCCWY